MRVVRCVPVAVFSAFSVRFCGTLVAKLQADCISTTIEMIMKKIMPLALLLAITVTAFHTSASSQVINGRLIGSVYTFEKFDTVNVSKKFVRGFQSVLLDVTQSDFSIHTHFQIAGMLQKKLDEKPDYRFYYLYGQWKNIFSTADLSFGRLPYFAGVGNGTIDGGLLTLRFAENKFKFTAYGGQTTPIEYELKDWKKLKNNFTVGGQLVVSAIENARIGVSYMNRQRERNGYFATREDSLLNPIQVYINPGQAKEQYVSGDVSYRFSSSSLSSVYGRYDYDLNFKKTQRGQFGVRLGLCDDLSISGDFIHREPRVLFNSFFSIFDLKAVNEYELGADYILFPEARAFVRGAYVKYSGDESFRYTFGIAHRYVSFTYRGSNGYAGELDNASIQATYPLFDNRLMPSVGLAYMTYRLDDASKREDGIAGTLGATLRPMSQLSFDVQGQWLRNKIVQNDVRLFAKVNFWFTTQL